MNSERAALAKSLLAKRMPKVDSLKKQQGNLQHPPQSEDFSQYAHIHPETLAHAHRMLGNFVKGVKDGR